MARNRCSARFVWLGIKIGIHQEILLHASRRTSPVLKKHNVLSLKTLADIKAMYQMQQKQQPSLFSVVNGKSTVQQVTPTVGGAPNNQDLFTITYSPAPVPVLGWQAATPHGMGFGMQYPKAMPAFPQKSKTTNPFDFGTEPTPVHTPMALKQDSRCRQQC